MFPKYMLFVVFPDVTKHFVQCLDFMGFFFIYFILFCPCLVFDILFAPCLTLACVFGFLPSVLELF